LTFDDYTVTFDASSNYYVNDVQTGAVVTTGVYDPLGTTVTFDGIRITMTGAAAATDSFSVGSPLPDVIKNFAVGITDVKKIAAASAAASPGDNTNAVALANLSSNAVADLGGETFMNYYKGLVSTVGVMSRAASDSLTFDNNLLADIENRRNSVSGVSLDEEATNLMKFQRSFEAGAKMVQVADELVQTVMSMVTM
jgi:flagellar hook-associated protein 1 FlgK